MAREICKISSLGTPNQIPIESEILGDCVFAILGYFTQTKECDALNTTHINIKSHVKDLLPSWPHVTRGAGKNTCKWCSSQEGTGRAGQLELRK